MEQRRSQLLGLIVHEILRVICWKVDAMQICKHLIRRRLMRKRKSWWKAIRFTFSTTHFLRLGRYSGEFFLAWGQGNSSPGGKQKRPWSDYSKGWRGFNRGTLKPVKAKVLMPIKSANTWKFVSKLSQKPTKAILCYLETGLIEGGFA